MHRVYIALLHYPVYNKNLEVITTSITNLDLHDISRTARTYGARRFFIVHPLASQRRLIQEMMEYWREGFGASYNPDRKEAMDLVELAEGMDEVLLKVKEREGRDPLTVATDARTYPNTVGYRELKEKIKTLDRPFLILFGTGWGLTQDFIRSCDFILEPIQPNSDYNHLSVRSAVAIILDRLLGEMF